jgi:hypothetical protein
MRATAWADRLPRGHPISLGTHRGQHPHIQLQVLTNPRLESVHHRTRRLRAYLGAESDASAARTVFLAIANLRTIAFPPPYAAGGSQAVLHAYHPSSASAAQLAGQTRLTVSGAEALQVVADGWAPASAEIIA